MFAYVCIFYSLLRSAVPLYLFASLYVYMENSTPRRFKTWRLTVTYYIAHTYTRATYTHASGVTRNAHMSVPLTHRAYRSPVAFESLPSAHVCSGKLLVGGTV